MASRYAVDSSQRFLAQRISHSLPAVKHHHSTVDDRQFFAVGGPSDVVQMTEFLVFDLLDQFLISQPPDAGDAVEARGGQ